MRSSLSDEQGWSLVELLFVLALSGVVTAMVAGFLTSSQNTLGRQTARSISNDQIRLAAQSFDREVRSGNVVYNPASESFSAGDIAPGMSVRVYAQTNGDPRCVQWRITSTGELQRRSWPAYYNPANPAHVSAVSGWRIVAEHVTNRIESIAAFTRPDTNLLTIRLRANDDPAKGSTVEVTQSVSGRNTLRFPTGTATQVCGPSTPDPSLAGSGRVPAY